MITDFTKSRVIQLTFWIFRRQNWSSSSRRFGQDGSRGSSRIWFGCCSGSGTYQSRRYADYRYSRPCSYPVYQRLPETRQRSVWYDFHHEIQCDNPVYCVDDILTLGLSGSLADDGKPYTTLSYANGPGFYDNYDENEPNGRRNLTGVNTGNTKNNIFHAVVTKRVF